METGKCWKSANATTGGPEINIYQQALGHYHFSSIFIRHGCKDPIYNRKFEVEGVGGTRLIETWCSVGTAENFHLGLRKFCTSPNS